MTTDLILGTAGHIDHGKTALIKALTGTDTDRLPEEKKRGITIELGFAELALGDFRLGVVDVPGHERFVRNMLSGATGVDLALLVVAADDSVKPQTREHLEILRLLRLRHGVIALTKCDLADADWLELVADEVRELVAGTFLRDAPLVRTSVVTRQGIDELRRALTDAARRAATNRERPDGEPFRMAIDRAFTLAGHGAVVTGSVTRGAASLGDELDLEPGGARVRVRGLQNHDRDASSVRRGQRASINLAGVRHGDIVRGQELATPGHLVASRVMTLQLRLLPTAPRPLKNRARVRLHVGAGEYAASVSLLQSEALKPGDTALAQVFLSEPAVATWGQAFVVRSESPAATIAGGMVLDPAATKVRRGETGKLRQLAQLASEDAMARAAAAAYLAGLRDWKPADLARTAGIDNPRDVVAELEEQGVLTPLKVTPTRTLLVSRAALEEIHASWEKTLARLHERFPLQITIDASRLLNRFRYLGEGALLEAVLDSLCQTGRVRRSPGGLTLQGHGPQLSKHEQSLLEEIVARYLEAGFEPPTADEVQAGVTRNRASVPELFALATAEGRLIRVSPSLYLHREHELRLRDILTERLRSGAGLTVSEIRELLGVSRKYAVPFCEHLDSIGLTRRLGDKRVLAE